MEPVGKIVKFETVDYYKLRTRIADAQAAVTHANRLIAAKDALLKELSEQYGFDPACKTWQADDETESFSFS